MRTINTIDTSDVSFHRGPPRGYISNILHVKTKESGPIGGARPPRSANGNEQYVM